MSYSYITDFLGLLRSTSGGERAVRAPTLDVVLTSLARAGLFRLAVQTTAPVVNQPTMAWFRPAQQPWAAEGSLFLWNPATAQYEPATPALFLLLLQAG